MDETTSGGRIVVVVHPKTHGLELAILLVGILLALAICSGCELELQLEPTPAPSPDCQPEQDCIQCPYGPCPPADLPVEMRQLNWGPSCYHAAVVDTLRAQDQHAMADWWRKTQGGGSYTATILQIADKAGVRYAATLDGDAEFLDWCSETRRAAAILWQVDRPGDHAITFLGYIDWEAVLVDNRDPHTAFRLPKDEFLAKWRRCGGDAIAPVYSPPPRRPWI